jgi:hypothetical protein
MYTTFMYSYNIHYKIIMIYKYIIYRTYLIHKESKSNIIPKFNM